MIFASGRGARAAGYQSSSPSRDHVMRHASKMSLPFFALVLSLVVSPTAWARRQAEAPAAAPVTMSPERAALLSQTPTAVPMPQTAIGWIKSCPLAARPDDCSVSGGFSLKPDSPPNLQLTLGTASTDGTRTLSVLLPLNVALRPGFTVLLDDRRAILGDYASCSAVGCSGQVGLSGADYEKLIHGKQLGVLIANGGDKVLRLDLSLAGMSDVARGPATTPADMTKRHDAAVETWKAAAARAAKEKAAATTAAAKN